jgi:sugar O-acyltransferase (sialic acid O-acetyltransferase NeuD family)
MSEMTVQRVGQPLVIVGAGGLGRETVAVVRAVNAVAPTWDLLGFLDDGPDMVGQVLDGVTVLGPSSLLASGAPVKGWRRLGVRTGRPAAVMSTASPRAFSTRAAIEARLDPATTYASVVHPMASLAAGTEVGAGSILLAHVVTTAPVAIGRHVAVMPHVVFTHDNVIGDYATFGAGAKLAGGVSVGSGAYIGSGALVREHVNIGEGSLVGMGAVVTRDVPAGEVWAGNPARRLRPFQAEVPAPEVA